MKRSSRTALLCVVIVFSAVAAAADTVVVDAQLATPSDRPVPPQHLAIAEGAAMEPFFDSGHIVFDAPADQAATLGASLVFRVFLDLAVSEESLLPSGIQYELHSVAEGTILAEGRIDGDMESQLTVDQQLILLATTAAEHALALWMQM